MVKVVRKGSILVETRVWIIRIYGILHVSTLHANLLFISKLISRGLKVYYNLLGCAVKVSNGKMLAVASTKSNLYQLDMNVRNGVEMNSLTHSMENWDFLEFKHKRLGHLNAKNVNMLQAMMNMMDVETVQGDM